MNRTPRKTKTPTNLARHTEPDDHVPPMRPLPADPVGPKVKCIVSPGRVVHAPNGKKFFAGNALVQKADSNGAVRDVWVERWGTQVDVVRPGGTVLLPEEEADRLVALGFVERADQVKRRKPGDPVPFPDPRRDQRLATAKGPIKESDPPLG